MSNTRRKIEDKISKKHKEIQELETTLITLRAEVRGMEDVLKMLPIDGETAVHRDVRPNSVAGKVQKFLRKRGHPAYISEILEGIKKANNAKNRATVAGTLSQYVRRKEVFSRPVANTFGLLEWGDQPLSEDDEKNKAPPPPPDFLSLKTG